MKTAAVLVRAKLKISLRYFPPRREERDKSNVIAAISSRMSRNARAAVIRPQRSRNYYHYMLRIDYDT